jgi:hypothetical protein
MCVCMFVGVGAMFLTVQKLNKTPNFKGHAVAQFVEALRCYPEGRVFDSRWCHRNISLT